MLEIKQNKKYVLSHFYELLEWLRVNAWQCLNLGILLLINNNGFHHVITVLHSDKDKHQLHLKPGITCNNCCTTIVQSPVTTYPSCVPLLMLHNVCTHKYQLSHYFQNHAIYPLHL